MDESPVKLNRNIRMKEPCENHGLSRNCNHQKGFATDVHCSKDGKDGKNGESQDTCLCGLTMLSRNKARVSPYQTDTRPGKYTPAYSLFCES